MPCAANMQDKTQHTYVITGAGQRAGLALAEHWLAAGHQVIFSYRQLKPGVMALEQQGALGIQADFSTNEGILAFAQAVQQQSDLVHLLVHNASEWSADPKKEDQEAWQQVAARHQRLFQVHQQAPYLLNFALEPQLRAAAQQSGQATQIIHLTDDAVRRGSAKHGAYLATKAALENLTYSFAARFAPQIRVNAIAPALLAFNDGDSEAYRAEALQKSLLGIEPGFTSLVQAVDYLIHQPYTTGSILPLNGGRHLK